MLCYEVMDQHLEEAQEGRRTLLQPSPRPALKLHLHGVVFAHLVVCRPIKIAFSSKNSFSKYLFISSLYKMEKKRLSTLKVALGEGLAPLSSPVFTAW